MIASILTALLPELNVRSAGTAAPRGEPWHPMALEALAERGQVVDGVAHQLCAADVRGAKLILTAEGAHRAEVVRLDPTAEVRCYTLLEAARLIARAPDGPGGAGGVAARLEDALGEQREEFNDDLADPLSGTLADFRGCLERIETALGVVAPGLGATT